jgi:hypothetical protein
MTFTPKPTGAPQESRTGSALTFGRSQPIAVGYPPVSVRLSTDALAAAGWPGGLPPSNRLRQ